MHQIQTVLHITQRRVETELSRRARRQVVRQELSWRDGVQYLLTSNLIHWERKVLVSTHLHSLSATNAQSMSSQMSDVGQSYQRWGREVNILLSKLSATMFSGESELTCRMESGSDQSITRSSWWIAQQHQGVNFNRGSKGSFGAQKHKSVFWQ